MTPALPVACTTAVPTACSSAPTHRGSTLLSHRTQRRRRHSSIKTSHSQPQTGFSDTGSPTAVCFSLIVDDLVLPDGSTTMGQLGGGGPQSLFGYQLYQRQPAHVALAAGVGADLPQSCRDALRLVGVEASTLLYTESSTPRAWQLTELDGRRTQVWRTLFTQQQRDSLLRPPLSALPPAFASASGFHMGVHPESPPLELLADLRFAADAYSPPGPDKPSSQGLLSVEPFIRASERPSAEALASFLEIPHIFSPNLEEARSLVGPGSVQQAAARLLDAGAQVLTLRCGREGCYIFRGGSSEGYHIPAYVEGSIVDVTGCGNAWCGAFLAAAQAGESDATAGLWGSAAASFMAECRAFPVESPADLHTLAAERVSALAAGVSRVRL